MTATTCTCPGDYRNGYGENGRHHAFCDSLTKPFAPAYRMKHCSLCAKDYPATEDTWRSECPDCIEHSNQMRERRDAILAEKRGKQ